MCRYIVILLIFLVSCKEKKTGVYNHYNNSDSSKSYGNGHIIYVGDTAILGEYKIIYDTVYIHDTIVQRVGRGNRSRYFNTTDSIIVVGDNNYIITHEK